MPDVYARPGILEEMRTGYYPEHADFFSMGDFDVQLLRSAVLRRYARRGQLLGTHMAGSYFNRRALVDAGISRVSVLMRDPRDCTVSFTHHIDRAGPDLRNYHSVYQYVPRDYFEWSHARKLAFQVRTFLPRAVQWVESWLGAFAEDEPGLKIQLLFFDDLRRDAAQFMEGLLAFHAVEAVNPGALPKASEMAHFRKGEHGQWKDEFAAADRAFSDALLGDRWEQAFGRAADSHRRLARARECQSEGAFCAAAWHYFEVLQTFPRAEGALQGLAGACEQAAVPIAPGIREALTQYAKEPARWFEAPRELLADLRRGLPQRPPEMV